MYMTKAELVSYLAEFPDSAKVEVCIGNYPEPYRLMFGGSDGCTKATADTISFHVRQGNNLEVVSTPFFEDDEECMYCNRAIGSRHESWCRQ